MSWPEALRQEKDEAGCGMTTATLELVYNKVDLLTLDAKMTTFLDRRQKKVKLSALDFLARIFSDAFTHPLDMDTAP